MSLTSLWVPLGREGGEITEGISPGNLSMLAGSNYWHVPDFTVSTPWQRGRGDYRGDQPREPLHASREQLLACPWLHCEYPLAGREGESPRGLVPGTSPCWPGPTTGTSLTSLWVSPAGREGGREGINLGNPSMLARTNYWHLTDFTVSIPGRKGGREEISPGTLSMLAGNNYWHLTDFTVSIPGREGERGSVSGIPPC